MSNKTQCPNCGSYDTTDGRQTLGTDLLIEVIMFLSVVLSPVALFWPLWMIVKGARGKYSGDLHLCKHCNYDWED